MDIYTAASHTGMVHTAISLTQAYILRLFLCARKIVVYRIGPQLGTK